jgi:hypothetical protein
MEMRTLGILYATNFAKMKARLSFLIAIFPGVFLAVNGYGQCPTNNMPVNEIGIRLGSLTNASNDGGIQIKERSTSLGIFNGLHYKRYGMFGAFRTSLGLTQYDHETRRNCPDCLRTDGKVTSLTLRAGYEWFAILGPIEPFVGLDAVFAYGKYKSETWSSSQSNYREYTDVRERRGFGLGPVAGLRFYLGYAVSISAETSVQSMFFGRSTVLSQISPEPSTTARTTNYFETTFQPLNWLSLNVMF